MSVTLIAAVVALLLGHLAPSLAASVRHYGWYADWLRWLGSRFPAASVWHGPWGIALALAPPLLAVGLFQLALDEPFYGLAGVLFGIAVLFYTWGPRDLDLDVDAIVDAPDALSRREAATRLWPDEGVAGIDPVGLGQAGSDQGGFAQDAFAQGGPDEDAVERRRSARDALDGGALVGAVFHSALRRWFGVLFWFLLLGPTGALLYRLAAVSVQREIAASLPAATAAGARTLLAVLDWPVAQLMTLALALVGNFDTTLGAWRDSGGASFSLDHRFLAAAARASVRVELVEDAEDTVPTRAGGSPTGAAHLPPTMVTDMPELRDAMSLVWRSLLVWLAVLALFVIAGWVN